MKNLRKRALSDEHHCVLDGLIRMTYEIYVAHKQIHSQHMSQFLDAQDILTFRVRIRVHCTGCRSEIKFTIA